MSRKQTDSPALIYRIFFPSQFQKQATHPSYSPIIMLPISLVSIPSLRVFLAASDRQQKTQARVCPWHCHLEDYKQIARQVASLYPDSSFLQSTIIVRNGVLPACGVTVQRASESEVGAQARVDRTWRKPSRPPRTRRQGEDIGAGESRAYRHLHPFWTAGRV